MDIKRILDFLPLDLTEDLYFQNLLTIIVNSLKNDSQILQKVQVNQEIYEKLDKNDKDLVTNQDGNNLVHFMYRSNDSISSFGVKKNVDSFYVYYEVNSFSKMSRTILIRGLLGIIVETKETLKEQGIFKSYDVNVYYYDTDYREIEFDNNDVLDKIFSDEFGIPQTLARVMRNNFSKYAKYLSILYSEQKMKAHDDKLSDIDFLYFRSPWLVSEVREFIIDEYNIDLKNVIKRVFNKSAKSTHLNNMSGIEKIIEWIQTNLDSNSEFVISNNIYQNLVPIITGEYAMGFDTKGVIVEKKGEEYFLYQVHFTTNDIYFTKSLITNDIARELFLSNPQNIDVAGLREFFGITRGR